MTTVKDRLIALVETDSARRLVTAWMDEGYDDLCARQRAWQEVHARIARGSVRFRW